MLFYPDNAPQNLFEIIIAKRHGKMMIAAYLQLLCEAIKNTGKMPENDIV